MATTLYPQTVKIDLNPANKKYETVDVSQFDVGRPLIFEVYNGKDQILLDDASVPKISFITSDKNLESYVYSCGVRNGVAYIATKPPMATYSGKFKVSFLAYNAQGTLIGVGYFLIYVEKTVITDPNSWTSKNTIPAIIDQGKDNLKKTIAAKDDILGRVIRSDAFQAWSEAHAVGKGSYEDETGEEVEIEDPLSSKHYADLSRSFAKGDTRLRVDEDHDNAEFFAKEAKSALASSNGIRNNLASMAQSMGGKFTVMGVINSTDLFKINMYTEAFEGMAYIISNTFTTTNDFRTPDKVVKKGNIVFFTKYKKWDIMPEEVNFKVSEMYGATPTADGIGGIVPQPYQGQEDNFLKADGSWTYIYKAIDLLSLVPTIAYPIGSVYMSILNIDPANYFGGTWEEITSEDTVMNLDGNKYNVALDGVRVWKRVA